MLFMLLNEVLGERLKGDSTWKDDIGEVRDGGTIDGLKRWSDSYERRGLRTYRRIWWNPKSYRPATRRSKIILINIGILITLQRQGKRGLYEYKLYEKKVR